MKSTKAYVREFGLDNLDTAKKFNREEFLKAFGNEFNERLQVTMTACKKMDVSFTYQKFLNLVNEQHSKFNAISNKKLGGVLSEDLFKAFYAMYVVKHRETIFPEIHQQLSEAAEKAREQAELKANKIAEEVAYREKLEAIKKAQNKQKALEMVDNVKGTLQKKGIKIQPTETTLKEKVINPKSKSTKKAKGL